MTASIIGAVSAAIAFFGLALSMLNLAHKQGKLLGKIEQQVEHNADDIDLLWQNQREQDADIDTVETDLITLKTLTGEMAKNVKELHDHFLREGLKK